MSKILGRVLGLLAAFCLSTPALAQQSSPGFVTGFVPTAAQWNSYFAGKLDYNAAGLPQSLGGTGATTAPAAVTALGTTSVINPVNYGAHCDGTAHVPDDTAGLQAAADVAFGPSTAPHGTNYQLNVPLYIPGHCLISSPILVTKVQGGKIFGDARFKAYIENTAGTGVFKTDGFQYSTVSGITFQDDGTTATVFDLNKTTSGGPSLQSDTFSDNYFVGGGIGVNIGQGGLQGSEMLFLNDFWNACAIAGLKTSNFNALQNTVVGGDFQSNTLGVWMRQGTVDVYSTGFQQSTTYDVQIDNSANDAVVMSGIRTESPNFLFGTNGIVVRMTGVSQESSTSGIYAVVGGTLSIDGGNSVNGQIGQANGQWSVRDSRFGRSDWFVPANGGSGSMANSEMHVSNVTVGYSGTPTYILDKIWNKQTKQPPQPQWPDQTAYLPIPAGSTTYQWDFPANTNVVSVETAFRTPGSAGTIDVGDTASATTYMSGQSVTGANATSTTRQQFYAATDHILITTHGVTGLTGYVVVKTQLQN